MPTSKYHLPCPPRPPLGEFELLVLLSVASFRDAIAYGYPIQMDLCRRARREVSLGTIYKTLHRLQAKTLVQSSYTAPTLRPGGRRKRRYALTPQGRVALHSTMTTLCRMFRQLDPVP